MALVRNSGNLIVKTTKQAAAVERELAKAIKDTFGFNIDVTVRTDAQLRKVLANNPYPDGNPSQVTVAFLMKAPDARAKERVTSMAAEHEPLTFAGRGLRQLLSTGWAPASWRRSSARSSASALRSAPSGRLLVEMCGKS